MRFCLSEEQEAIQHALGAFLGEQCPPRRARAAYDRDEPSGADRPLWSELGRLGYTSLLTPSEHGGAGLGLLEAALVSEQLGRAAAPVGLEWHLLATLAIARYGTEGQKAEHLGKVAQGDHICTVALGEPSGAWEPSAWTVSLQNGRLRGVKAFVPLADAANVFVVGCEGGRLAVVDAARLAAPLRPMKGVDRSRNIFEVDFTGTPAELLEMADSEAFYGAGLTLLAADAFGAASRLIELSTEHALTRMQFGQPIGQFQAVKHSLAELAVSILGARGLWWYAAHAYDVGSADFPRVASLAKSHITEKALDAGRASVELHGGMGFTWECDVQLFLKRTYLDKFYLGSPELHRERCASLGGWSS